VKLVVRRERIEGGMAGIDAVIDERRAQPLAETSARSAR
jgi:hypothetical protein